MAIGGTVLHLMHPVGLTCAIEPLPGRQVWVVLAAMLSRFLYATLRRPCCRRVVLARCVISVI